MSISGAKESKMLLESFLLAAKGKKIQFNWVKIN
jgi:hypothetical protein